MFWSFDKFLTFDVLIFNFQCSDFCSSDPFRQLACLKWNQMVWFSVANNNKNIKYANPQRSKLSFFYFLIWADFVNKIGFNNYRKFFMIFYKPCLNRVVTFQTNKLADMIFQPNRKNSTYWKCKGSLFIWKPLSNKGRWCTVTHNT